MGIEIGPSGGGYTETSPTLDGRCKDGFIRNQIGAGVYDYAGDIAPGIKAEGPEVSRVGFDCEEALIPEIVSQAMSSKWSKQSSGSAGDECANLIPVIIPPLLAGDNRTGGPRPPDSDSDTVKSLIVTEPFSETADSLCSSYATKWNGNASAENGSLFVTHTLRAEHDGSEDGSGRGVPLVAVTEAEAAEIRKPRMVPTRRGDQMRYETSDEYWKRQNEMLPVSTFQNTGHGWWNESDTAQVVRGYDGGGSREANVVATMRSEGDAHSGFQDTEGLVLAPPLVSRGHSGSPFFDSSDGLVTEAPAVMTLALRGRDGGTELEVSEDGVANAVVTPNGGRGGINVGAVAIPIISDADRDGEALTPSSNGNGKHSLRNPGLGIGEDGDPMFTLRADGKHSVAFAQNTRDEVRLIGGDGESTGALSSQPGTKQQTYLAFGFDAGQSANPKATHQYGEEMTGPLIKERPQCVGQAVAFTCSEQANGYAWERPVYPALNAQVPNDGSNIQQGVREGMAVRRLTPRECERLMGFKDDYTLITPHTPDGPRYKALGNSMAVPCMAWIGKRLQMVEDLICEEEQGCLLS